MGRTSIFKTMNLDPEKTAHSVIDSPFIPPSISPSTLKPFYKKGPSTRKQRSQPLRNKL